MLVKAPELIFFSGSKESSSRVLSIQRMMILLKSEATWATHSERGDNGDGGEIGGVGGEVLPVWLPPGSMAEGC